MLDLSPPRPIESTDTVSGFDCGQSELNHYLISNALNNQKAMLSRTYVVCSPERVLGFYTLAISTVLQAESPPKLVRGMPPYPVPAILMARLAVDLSAQGLGLGRSLLVDSLQRTWNLMQHGPVTARLFIVDAKDETAKAFYRKFNMVESPVDPLRLFLSYKSIKQLFDSPA